MGQMDLFASQSKLPRCESRNYTVDAVAEVEVGVTLYWPFRFHIHPTTIYSQLTLNRIVIIEILKKEFSCRPARTDILDGLMTIPTCRLELEHLPADPQARIFALGTIYPGQQADFIQRGRHGWERGRGAVFHGPLHQHDLFLGCALSGNHTSPRRR